jgi:acyl-CoA dehydrogenase
VATLEEAFALSVLTERARETMRKAGIDEPETAVANGDITNEEAAQISNYRAVLARVVAVDDFAPAELSLHATPTNEEPRPVRAANA